MIEQIFRSILVAAIPPPSKLYEVTMPESAHMPSAVYAFIGGQSYPTFETSGLTRYRVEVSCYGRTYAEAARLRSVIIATLNGYRDANINDIDLIQRRDDFSYDSNTFRCLVEFYISTVL